MRFDSLKDALIFEVQDLYSAENQLVKGLPKMIAGATAPELKAALSDHLQETKGQVTRLEKILSKLGQKPNSEECEAMRGLLEEGDEVLSATGDPAVKNALIIGACQRVEHYEMAGYGTARAFASNLGLTEIADLLQETLDEEGAANKKLTGLAEDGWFEGGINSAARDGAGTRPTM